MNLCTQSLLTPNFLTFTDLCWQHFHLTFLWYIGQVRWANISAWQTWKIVLWLNKSPQLSSKILWKAFPEEWRLLQLRINWPGLWNKMSCTYMCKNPIQYIMVMLVLFFCHHKLYLKKQNPKKTSLWWTKLYLLASCRDKAGWQLEHVSRWLRSAQDSYSY